jgi:hypothetical protein
MSSYSALFYATGYLLFVCSVISVSFIICMLTLLLMPLAGLHSCVGLDFLTPLVVSKHIIIIMQQLLELEESKDMLLSAQQHTSASRVLPDLSER